MSARRLLDAIKKIDILVMLLVGVLAALAGGAAYAALFFGWFGSPLSMAAWLVACVAFVAAGAPAISHRIARNDNVHGAARPASEAEAQAVARGDTKVVSLHDRTFPD